MRQRILATLLIASFATVAATASAQNTAPDNTPRNAPVGASTAPPADGSADPASGANSPAAGSTTNAPAPVNSDQPSGMIDYQSARAACDQQPASSRAECQNEVNANHSGVAPECQKMSGAALDACLKGADAGQ